MKIVTANIPESYLEPINRLVGDDGLYPSRSELIRVALREFLIKELKAAEMRSDYVNKRTEMIQQKRDRYGENYVEIPDGEDENGQQIYKTYKVIRRLEDIGKL